MHLKDYIIFEYEYENTQRCRGYVCNIKDSLLELPTKNKKVRAHDHKSWKYLTLNMHPSLGYLLGTYAVNMNNQEIFSTLIFQTLHF